MRCERKMKFNIRANEKLNASAHFRRDAIHRVSVMVRYIGEAIDRRFIASLSR